MKTKKCECGCRAVVRSRFVHGHSSKLRKGKTLEKIFGVKKAKKIKKGASKAHLGKASWIKGLTKETDKRVKKISKTKKIRCNTKKFKEKMGSILKNNWANPNSKYNSKEFRRKNSKAKEKAHADPNSIYNSKVFRKKKSNIMKNLHANPSSKYNSKEFKEKHIKTCSTKNFRKEMRNIAIKRIERQKFNGEPLKPATGKYETQILNSLESCFYPYKILRQYRVVGHFLDGYCLALNLAIEVDEPRHFDIDGKLKKRDIERQKEIEEELKCRFLRIQAPG